MKKKLSLQALLSLTFVITLLISVSISYGLIVKNAANRVKQDEERLLLNTGKYLAEEPLIINQLKEEKTSLELQQYVARVSEVYHLDFIVVMTMDTLRLTHPDPKQIGKHFIGGDEQGALQGKSETSISKGTLGKSLRGFVPVYDTQDPSKQIGVVALGIKMNSLAEMINQSKKDYHLSLIISLLFSLSVAFALSLYLKRILLNLEPQEIASILEERNAMLEETKDVIVVIDLKQHILLANAQAQTLYQYTTQQTDCVGKPIEELLLHFDVTRLDKKTEQLYQQHGQDYLLSAAPIVVRGQTTGHILFLRNATETLFVTDQLANTTAYATALQSQSHEFMNKLHVIYGLVDLDAYDELHTYLEDLLQPEKEFARHLALLVKDPMIAGFLIGERQKFSEIKTTLTIDIFPEIPLCADAEKRTDFITMLRYVHHSFLQKKLPESLTLLLEWQEQQIQASYTFLPNDFDENDWADIKQGLDSFYLKQFLLETKSEMTFTADSLIIITQFPKEVT